MKNIKTVTVLFGDTLKHRIAGLMRKLGLIRVIYQRPVFGDDYNEIGAICTLKGNQAALWLIGVMFKQEEAIQFVIPKNRLEVI